MALAVSPRISRWFKSDGGLGFFCHPYSRIFDENNKLIKLETAEMCDVPTAFDMRIFCSAIQHGLDVDELRHSLDQYVEQYSGFLKFFHLFSQYALFYAVAFNRPDHIDLVLKLDKDSVNSSTYRHPVPLLAFAILNGDETATDSSEVVAKLLSAGIDPKTIPDELWTEGSQAPAALAQDRPTWCTKNIHGRLRSALTITHCYLLRWASEEAKANERTEQIAKGHDMSPLLKISHTVIGQRPVCDRAFDLVYSHIAMLKSEPLLIAFAGSAGDGKTELAKQIGRMISAESISVNCAEIRTSWGLFGSEVGYCDRDEGTALNNFLASNDGLHSVVFLDEFDKTDSRVVEALLEVCEKGISSDKRRTGHDIDCSKTIWIIATNLGDKTIVRHHERYLSSGSKNMNTRELRAELLQQYMGHFEDAFASRIREILPFMPSSREEQAVITHKFLIALDKKLKKPIDMKLNVKRFVGHSEIVLFNTKTLCTKLAEQSYVPAAGARSLKSAVANIEDEFCKAYSNMDGLVEESINNGPLLQFDLVMKATASGDVKFTVVKRTDALPEPEPEPKPETESTPPPVFLQMRDDEILTDDDFLGDDDEVRAPAFWPAAPPSPTGSQSSSSSQDRPKKKKNKRKR